MTAAAPQTAQDFAERASGIPGLVDNLHDGDPSVFVSYLELADGVQVEASTVRTINHRTT